MEEAAACRHPWRTLPRTPSGPPTDLCNRGTSACLKSCRNTILWWMRNLWSGSTSVATPWRGEMHAGRGPHLGPSHLAQVPLCLLDSSGCVGQSRTVGRPNRPPSHQFSRPRDLSSARRRSGGFLELQRLWFSRPEDVGQGAVQCGEISVGAPPIPLGACRQDGWALADSICHPTRSTRWGVQNGHWLMVLPLRPGNGVASGALVTPTEWELDWLQGLRIMRLCIHAIRVASTRSPSRPAWRFPMTGDFLGSVFG